MRRVLVDTNVLLAALVFPEGVAAQAFLKVLAEDQLVLTQWVLDEMREVVERKWPDRHLHLEQFLASLEYELASATSSHVTIRDARDQPILDAGIAAAVDILLTGDKDFLAIEIDQPRILTPRGYLDSA